jgi:CheY-like chemotaxis protein
VQRHSGSQEARRVLVIEDDEESRFFLAEHLTRAGYKVESAVDGNDGLACALRSKPDVIVLDLAMPGLDGWDTARLLRAYDATAAIPIVALTAIGFQEAHRRAMVVGCNAVLVKPHAPGELEQTLGDLLGDVPETDTA